MNQKKALSVDINAMVEEAVYGWERVAQTKVGR